MYNFISISSTVAVDIIDWYLKRMKTGTIFSKHRKIDRLNTSIVAYFDYSNNIVAVSLK